MADDGAIWVLSSLRLIAFNGPQPSPGSIRRPIFPSPIKTCFAIRLVCSPVIHLCHLPLFHSFNFGQTPGLPAKVAPTTEGPQHGLSFLCQVARPPFLTRCRDTLSQGAFFTVCYPTLAKGSLGSLSSAGRHPRRPQEISALAMRRFANKALVMGGW